MKYTDHCQKEKNKIRIGLMKVEAGGKLIIEFVGLTAKFIVT